MTNGSYELNGKSNLGYVNSDSSDMPGAFHINDDNGNTFQTNSSKHEDKSLFSGNRRSIIIHKFNNTR